jgi:hypothetical protein
VSDAGTRSFKANEQQNKPKSKKQRGAKIVKVKGLFQALMGACKVKQSTIFHSIVICIFSIEAIHGYQPDTCVPGATSS